MNIETRIKTRFAQLATQIEQIPMNGSDRPYADEQAFYAWASSSLNLLMGVFGKESPHYEQLHAEISQTKDHYVEADHLNACKGIFLGAKSDVDDGYVFQLDRVISAEIFGDFVTAAKAALSEGQYTVATVLASSALEDALKKYATKNGLDVEGKNMEDVVNALKSKGLVGGAQTSLLSAMPKIRNHAMHAEWDKLTPQDAGSIIGFVEQFLLTHF
jgi:hypothetical protein